MIALLAALTQASHLNIDLCYYEVSSSDCNPNAIPITKTNCSNLADLCFYGNDCSFMISVVDNFSNDVFLSFETDQLKVMNISVNGNSKNRRINLEGIRMKSVRKLTLGMGTFDLSGSFEVNYVNLTENCALMNTANLTDVQTTEIQMIHLSKVYHGINLIIHGISTMNIIYYHDSWRINNNLVYFRNTLPVIIIPEHYTLSISKNSEYIHPILLKNFFRNVMAYQKIYINTEWNNDPALLFNGNFEIDAYTSSSIIPFNFGDDIDENGVMGVHVEVISATDVPFDKYEFSPTVFKKISTTLTAPIRIEGDSQQIVLQSYVFAEHDVEIRGYKNLYLNNTRFLSGSIVYLDNVRILDPIVYLEKNSKIVFGNVNLSSNIVVVETDMVGLSQFYHGGTKDDFPKFNHPKKYIIKVDASNYNGIFQEGKVFFTPLILEFYKVDDSILSYVDIVCTNNVYQGYKFEFNPQIGHDSKSNYYGINLNYTMKKLELPPTLAFTQSMTINPTQSIAPVTPDSTISATVSPTLSISPASPFMSLRQSLQISENSNNMSANPMSSYFLGFCIGVVVVVLGVAIISAIGCSHSNINRKEAFSESLIL